MKPAPRQTAKVTPCSLCGADTLQIQANGRSTILDRSAPVWMAETWDGVTTWHQVTGWVALVAHEAVCRGKK
jgi:hypothetical protein